MVRDMDIVPEPVDRVRDIRGLVVPRFGAVVSTDAPDLPWRVVSLPAPEDRRIIDDFLRDLTASDCSPATNRSYAYDLLRWWRFLAAVDRHWSRARREDVRDLVLWLRQARAGSGFAPATIDHQLSVLAVFYDFLGSRSQGPVMNPVPTVGTDPRRYAHHNPLEKYRPHRRAQYRQRIPQGPPKALADETVNQLFGKLSSHRDRAMVAMYLASGIRANELLGMRGRDVDWGNSMIGVISKGTRAYQKVPTSPDTLTWLRLYLSQGFDAPPDEPLWWTLREPRRPLQYTAVRAMLGRVTTGLDRRITLHDFRHTCATRLANDPSIPLTDVQAVLRHAQITTTARYVQPAMADIIQRFQVHQDRPVRPPDHPGWQYESADLEQLFGGPE